ncbi:MAG TPA: hypothetical protein VHV83_19700 [Armatimonadota bacterium]|nr:hypothetical protein [Armatimonadota bacterium]
MNSSIRQYCWSVVVILAFGAMTCAFAQQAATTTTVTNTVSPVVDIIGDGKIDWSKDQLRARGIGFAPKKTKSPALAMAQAREAAIVIAERNLLKVINGVHVTSETTVENLIMTQDTIKTKVSGLLRGAVIVSEKAIGTDGYEVVVAVNIFGGDSSLAESIDLADQLKTSNPDMTIVPVAQPQEPTVKPVTPPQQAAQQQPTPPQTTVVPDQTAGYTGLVVDCRGFGLTRSMCPRILDQTNTNIWGTVTVSEEIVNERGIAGYFKSMNDQNVKARVGNHPLIIKALRTSGGKVFKTDAVLSPADAEIVRAENAKSLFLEKLNVAFLID